MLIGLPEIGNKMVEGRRNVFGCLGGPADGEGFPGVEVHFPPRRRRWSGDAGIL